MSVPETVPKPIVRRTGDILGYARVLTCGQAAAGQHDWPPDRLLQMHYDELPSG